MKTSIKQYLFILLTLGLFTACDDDDDLTLPTPSIDNIEIGLGNNEMGVIGKDFHLNAKVLAGDKIETVQIRIRQRSGETYAKVWSHEITYDQYKGARNATIHQHFDIPADAAEGKYDFLITVNDQNGTKLEEKRNLTIYRDANLPVSPRVAILSLFAQDQLFWDGAFATPGAKLQKGVIINSQATITGVKGDGKIYLLLINKKLNHRPESVDQIDFSKMIVYDVLEHRNMEASEDGFSNSVWDLTTDPFTVVRDWASLTVGAPRDNNAPTPNAISGAKAWESGTYYFGVVYKNTTYNMGAFQYTEVPVVIN